MEAGRVDEDGVVDAIRAVFRAHGVCGEDSDADAYRIDDLLATHTTTDLVVEGVDFDRALYPWRCFGHRALAQNLSDLFAVDAEPRGFIWSLAIPGAGESAVDLDAVVAFAAGAAALAAAAGCPLLGGDLSTTSGPFVCSITAFGRTPGVPLTRGRARAGQGLYLTRKVGASAAGLRALRAARVGWDERAFSTWRKSLDAATAHAVRAHVEPMPFHDLESLADVAVAAIDVSDGLVKDAGRLAAASGVGVDLDNVAAVVDVGASVNDALYGGEDWCVLFAVPDGLPAPDGCFRVGRVVGGCGVRVDGVPVDVAGYAHGFLGRRSG